MKIVKPQKLGLLTRVFENDGQAYLVLTAMAFFPFSSPRKLLHEVALWQVAAQEMGRGEVLDAAMTKHRGEVLVCGKAFAKDGAPTTATSVRVRIATVDKELHVAGDRVWEANGPSEPVRFTEMPVTWERAFGGEGFAENPLGRGVRPIDAGGRKLHPLPNIESPAHRVRSPADRPPPAGLGPLDQTWPQRMRHAGTYDDAWLKTRYPGFPADLSWELFNVAPEDQRIHGYFKLDEAFRVEGMHPSKRAVEGRLPGVSARLFAVTRAGGEGVLREATSRIDTVILFPGVERGVVLFRGVLPIEEDDGADVLQVIAAFEDPAAPRGVEHYLAVRDRRADRRDGAIHTLIDDDLMPPWQDAGEAMAEDDWNDMSKVVATEGLQQASMRRKAERQIAEARKEWVSHGLDPAEFDRKVQPPKPPPKNVSELPAYVEDIEKQKDVLVAEAKAKQEDATARAREQCKSLGIDFDALMAQRKAEAGGPPKPVADRQLAQLRDAARVLRAEGKPSPALEERLADPAFEKKLREVDEKALEAYRRCAHVLPLAAPLSPEASARARDEIRRAVRAGESLAGRDYTGADLSGLDLSGADLSGALLEKVSLHGAVLGGAKLDGATLARADLSGARLEGASLRGANLGQADLRGADLDGADITECTLYEADLRGARLSGCKLAGALMVGVKIAGVDMSGADASELVFIDANLEGASLSRARLDGAVFLRCRAVDADLSGASLVKASFVESVCDGATFAGAELIGARFALATSLRGCDFKGARMKNALLRGCALTKADLEGVQAPECDFSEADLTEANLRRMSSPRSLFLRTIFHRASLEGADLTLSILQKAQLYGADVRGANLFRADMAKARGDKDTRLDGAYTLQVRTVPEKGTTRIVP